METTLLKLLLVSADQDSLSGLASAIRERDDANLLQADSGEDALKIAADTVIDLVVADEKLRDMTGLEFADKLVSVYPMIHCALVSGLSPENFHEVSEGLGIMAQLPMHPGKEHAEELLERLWHIKNLTAGVKDRGNSTLKKVPGN